MSAADLLSRRRFVPETSPPATLTRILLRWFADHAEELPWRRTTDPYAIWISEIMLQQTQVTTVAPYFKRWLTVLPEVRALAATPIERVLKLWEGLGYYLRARNLYQAAQIIVSRHGGRFPREFDAVLALPGIGRYTAGAICSIAFNQPRPILDGNVIRVLAREYGITEPARETATQKRLWSLATVLVEAARPPAGRRAVSSNEMGIGSRLVRETPYGALNQALMELGRRVCTPRQPRCKNCPLHRSCRARRENTIERVPNLGPRRAAVEQRVVAVVIERRGRFLVRQRPANGVNAGLWEFLNEPFDAAPVTPAVLIAHWPLVDTASLHPFTTIRHTITHRRITLEVWRGRAAIDPQPRAAAARWLRLGEAAQRPFTSAHRRILEKLRNEAAAGARCRPAIRASRKSPAPGRDHSLGPSLTPTPASP